MPKGFRRFRVQGLGVLREPRVLKGATSTHPWLRGSAGVGARYKFGLIGFFGVFGCSVLGAELGGLISPHYIGVCQNYGPFLDPYNSTAPNIQGTPKGS